MHLLPTHTAPIEGVCVSDLRIQLLVAVCVGMVHMIFSGSTKGTHTAPYEIVKLIYPVYVLYLHKSFRIKDNSDLGQFGPDSDLSCG